MATPRLQFSLLRLMALMLAWTIGLAAMSRLSSGPFSIGCALMYGVFASVIFLASSRRLLIVWCFSWILLTIFAVLLLMLSLDAKIPEVAGYVFLPAEKISMEQGWISSGCKGMVDALFIWPLLTGIALSPAMAVLVEIVQWARKSWKSKPPIV